MFFSNAVEDMHDENVCSIRETPNYFSLKKNGQKLPRAVPFGRGAGDVDLERESLGTTWKRSKFSINQASTDLVARSCRPPASSFFINTI
jgi:hypothetical protein